MALACHVIGPLDPATWKETASLRPSSSGAAALLTQGSVKDSDQVWPPGWTVTDFLPPANVTGRLVPGETAAPLHCSPANTASKVTGLVPNALLKRRRIRLPQSDGLMTRRKVWSFASGLGRANFSSGCSAGLPDGYGPCADAAQLVTQRSAWAGAARASKATRTNSRRIQAYCVAVWPGRGSTGGSAAMAVISTRQDGFASSAFTVARAGLW